MLVAFRSIAHLQDINPVHIVASLHRNQFNKKYLGKHI
jgi:hypothetical protein